MSRESTYATALMVPSERLTRAFHRYFLPVAGVEALLLGVLLLLGFWEQLGPYVSLSLLVVGAGVLVSSVGFHTWQKSHRSGVRESNPTGAKSTCPVPLPSTRRDPIRATAATGDPTTPHSGIGRAVASVPTKAGDVIWRQWLLPRLHPFGAELVGPVPETAYSPHAPGAFVAFPDRDRDIVSLSDDRSRVPPSISKDPVKSIPSSGPTAGSRKPSPPQLPSWPASWSEPLSEEELDFLFPRDLEPPTVEKTSPPAKGPPVVPSKDETVRPRVVPSPALSRVNQPSRSASPGLASSSAPRASPIPAELESEESLVAEAVTDLGSPFSGSFGILPTLDVIDHQVYLEAFNPIPPHLRSSISAGVQLSGKSAPSTPAKKPGPMFCAVCGGVVSDFRSWVHCLGCHQPICRHCLKTSFATGGEGLCADCREQQTPTAG